METQTSEPRRPIGSRRRRGKEERGESAGPGGGSREPGAQGRKRGRGARRRESPAPHSGPPFPHRALQVLVPSTPRARTRQAGTRSPDPPLKRPRREAPVPVRAALPPLVRARAPVRPPSGSPRAASRDRAQPRRQRRPRGASAAVAEAAGAAAPPAWSGRRGGVEKKGASDRNG